MTQEKMIFTYSDLLEMGNTKSKIKELVENKELRKVARGKYMKTSEIIDNYFVFQHNNEGLVFSNESALYLHHLIDTDIIGTYSVTAKRSYHTRKKNVKVYYVKDNYVNLGVMYYRTWVGNIIKVYDMDRTICDIIKNKNRINEDTYYKAIQNYFKSNQKNIGSLLFYAKVFKVEKRVYEVVRMFV